MPDLKDGETAEVKGSARDPYLLKNTGGVYSCTCPAWRNQSVAIERRTCKHLRAYRGEQAERDRLGSLAPLPPKTAKETGDKAPQLLLANSWENDADLTDWWMSEKLDGVRAWWTGKQFLSRLGNIYHAPDWFIAGLPSARWTASCGWTARRSNAPSASSAARTRATTGGRSNMSCSTLPKSMVPSRNGRRPSPSWSGRIVRHMRACWNRPAARASRPLKPSLPASRRSGGEGLMLRQPGSPYEAGRSPTLLKVKTFHDAEGKVVELLPGKGRHAGRLGAVVVELPSGLTFSVGTGFSDAQREAPPPVGSVITYRYQEMTDRGVPRFPSFVRVRTEAAQPKAAAARPADSKQVPSKPKPGETAMKRHFEFVEGNSAKFWEISTGGNDVTVRFGRIGTNGQTQTKTFADAAAAAKHAEKLIKEKTTKGYQEKPLTS